MAVIDVQSFKEAGFMTNETYKVLRTNIEFCGEGIRKIALTSCTPNEGKTSVSLNLAISLAEAGKKVLLIDADLRKSVLLGRLRIGTATRGLVHYLSGMNNFAQVTYKTNIAGLNIILAGPQAPNPAELFSGEKFSDLLKEAEKQYDTIIVDTPPLGSVIDAAIIGSQCDGVAIVVEAGAISYKFVQKVKEQLDQTNCHIIGVILNKVEMRRNGYYGKYYGRYYGHYYGSYYGEETDS